MQTLFNDLTNGTPEYKDNGQIIVHAPTKLMLRAARVLKQLSDTNETNTATVLQLQTREAELLSDLERAYEDIKELKRVISDNSSVGEPVLPSGTENAEGSGI